MGEALISAFSENINASNNSGTGFILLIVRGNETKSISLDPKIKTVVLLNLTVPGSIAVGAEGFNFSNYNSNDYTQPLYVDNINHRELNGVMASIIYAMGSAVSSTGIPYNISMNGNTLTISGTAGNGSDRNFRFAFHMLALPYELTLYQ